VLTLNWLKACPLVSIALNIAITATWVCKLKLELVSVLATLAKAVPKLSKLEEYVSKSDKSSC
jgi:hypothetical protein